MRTLLHTRIGIAGLALATTACAGMMPVSQSLNSGQSTLDLHLNTPTTRLFATSPNFVEQSRSIVQGTKLPYGGCLDEIRANPAANGMTVREVEYDPKTCTSIVAHGQMFVVTATAIR